MITIKELREKCEKPYWGAIHKFYHQIAFYLTVPIINTSITPNQITVLWVFIQTLGAMIVSRGTYKTMLLGIVIYHLGFFFDCVDGNIARYRRKSSLKGVYLEQIAHHITITFLMIALTVAVYKIYQREILILIGIVGILGFMFDKMFAINSFHFKSHTQVSKNDDDLNQVLSRSNLKQKNKIITTLFALVRVEHPFNLLFFLILFNVPHIALMFYSFMFFAEMLRKLTSTIIKLGQIDNKREI